METREIYFETMLMDLDEINFISKKLRCDGWTETVIEVYDGRIYKLKMKREIIRLRKQDMVFDFAFVVEKGLYP